MDRRDRPALTEVERAELASLQARVYGAGGLPVDDVSVRRLRTLEDRASGRVVPAPEREVCSRASDERFGPDAGAPAPTPASDVQRESRGAPAPTSASGEQRESRSAPDAGPPAPTPASGEQPESRSAPDAASPLPTPASRRRRLRPGLVGAAAVIVAGAFVAGLAVGRATDAGSGGEPLPEEGFAQTEEDLSSSILSDGRTWIGLEAASVRFIATIDDASVYLGRREEGELCLAVVYGSERGSGVASVDCGDRDATAQIDGDRWVSIGRADPAKMNNWSPSRLEQSQLSPSVTLHVLAR